MAAELTFKPNEEQQRAIDTLKGQVMLLAGPGTGKTFTIINRIAKMLKEGINPSEILCLTYSDAAANEMRQRLISEVGVLASSVDIYTYHSFCNDIIKTYPAEFDLEPNVRLISEMEQNTLMKECIDEADIKFFVTKKFDKYFHTSTLVNQMGKLKAQRITKEEYLSHIDTNEDLMPEYKRLESEIYEREQAGKTQNKGRRDNLEKILQKIEKSKEIWKLFELYTNKMAAKNLIDFSDMINFVLNVFEQDEKFKKKVSSKYKYFLVDEYQDTNDSQNAIIFNLLDGNEEKNIFVVGDDDQIIYGFQGANTNNLENFLTRYPDTLVICLKDNNRSTKSILDFSYEFITQDKNRLENNPEFKSKNISKKLTAKNESIIAKDKKINFCRFSDKLQEMNYIVDSIKKLINSDDCPKDKDGNKKFSEIAIIARKKKELYAFTELLKGKNIQFQLKEGKSIFAIRSTILLYFYIKTLNNYLLSDDKLFALLLSEPFKLNLEDYNKILEEKRLYKKEPHNFITIMQSRHDWKEPQKINDFLKTFYYLKEYSENNSLRSTIIETLNRTGMLVSLFKNIESKTENLMGIKKFIELATEFETLEKTSGLNDFVQYLNECLNNDINILTDEGEFIQNAVQLTTYHGSKGREFEFVFLPNLIENNWAKHKNSSEYKLITEKKLTEEEERSEQLRLLFVGITRAKHSLFLSYSDMDGDRAQQICSYFADFSDYDFNRITPEYKDYEDEFIQSISTEVFDNQKAFVNEIRERVNHLVLSPSRMNEYIQCPRMFFYTKVLKIDINDANVDNANFGTLIHSMLETSAKYAKETGTYYSLEEVKEKYEKALNTKRFSSPAKKEQYLKHGLKVLDDYYPHFIQTPTTQINNLEFYFDGIKVGDNTIRGTIDRIEKNPDGTYSLYDYKTGTPKSSNQVEIGKEKENYFNQLCFYKYAYEKLTGNKVSTTAIIYIENHSASVFKELTDTDMEYIENTIKTTYEDIQALKFAPKPGNCEYCNYSHLCKLNLI